MATRHESSDESSVTPDAVAGERRDEQTVGRPGDAEASAAERAETVGARAVTASARAARPQRRQPAVPETGRRSVPAPKGGRTRPVVAQRRTTPVQFVNESVDELKKVAWPTWGEVRRYFGAVLVLVVVLISFVGLLDLLFGWTLLRLFG